MKVRTRFAPSPTGYLHIGGLRTALFAYAFAKHQQGQFILRIEDTDRDRYVPGATEKIYSQLRLFGLDWDEGPETGGPFAPYVQTERIKSGIYTKYAQQLLAQGQAFYCFCPPQTTREIQEEHDRGISVMRDENCRVLTETQIREKLNNGAKPAIRLRAPEAEKISFYDLVLQKEVTWDSRHVDDAMLLKSDGFPTYQLAVVVDDHLMEISHILRALEWLPSTPIHLLLFRYLNFPLPQIGHLTDILDPAGGKLSKRKGNVSTEEFLSRGYLPEAILNFLMLLGWAPKDNRELFTLTEFVENFDPAGLQKANAALNTEKLNWFNQQYLKKIPDRELADRISALLKLSADDILPWLPLVRDRLVTLRDFLPLTEYFRSRPVPDWSQFSFAPELRSKILAQAREVLVAEFDGGKLEAAARDYCRENNLRVGDYFMILRVAITGRSATPPLWDVMQRLGPEETLARLKD